LVCHGHFLVNGKRLDIPSYRMREGDGVSLRERSQSLTTVAAALEDVRIARPEWVEFDEGKTIATVKGLPKVDSVPFALEIDLVIEYYSKRL
jgi:small subunit ribosomal protein S4